MERKPGRELEVATVSEVLGDPGRIGFRRGSNTARPRRSESFYRNPPSWSATTSQTWSTGKRADRGRRFALRFTLQRNTCSPLFPSNLSSISSRAGRRKLHRAVIPLAPNAKESHKWIGQPFFKAS